MLKSPGSYSGKEGVSEMDDLGDSDISWSAAFGVSKKESSVPALHSESATSDADDLIKNIPQSALTYSSPGMNLCIRIPVTLKTV